MKAFPRTTKMWKNSNEDSYEIVSDEGMDLRDYFASKAMPVYLKRFGPSEGFSKLETCELVAGWSYAMADAMMRARK